jgi:hypothetical protein
LKLVELSTQTGRIEKQLRIVCRAI